MDLQYDVLYMHTVATSFFVVVKPTNIINIFTVSSWKLSWQVVDAIAPIIKKRLIYVNDNATILFEPSLLKFPPICKCYVRCQSYICCILNIPG